MPIIQITNTYKGEVRKIVEDCTPEGFIVRTLNSNSQEELETLIGDADYMLASGRVKINSDVLENARNLKMIQRTGVGLDSLDLDAIRSAGIPLYVNKGVNAQSVAEHAILLMLACLRKLTIIDRNSKIGIWKSKEQAITTHELHGKTVGLIGLGNIGSRVATILKAFGVKTVYYAAYRESTETEKELGAEFVSMEQVFSQADIISLHCPLTPDTKGLIDDSALALMKDGVIIINTARGGLIDEKALYRAIESGRVGFAGLDVYAKEPFSTDNKLIASERVIASPHIAGVTYDAFAKMITEAMKNIVLFDRGEIGAIEQNRVV